MNIHKVEGNFLPSEDRKCSVSKRGMVSTAFPEATNAGVQMLELGGNAIDAACAAAFALSVCEPQASGIGGQSMALMHLSGKTIAIDGSSRVPSLTHIDSIEKSERFTGYRATTVPSTPAVLAHMHFRYGKLGWKTILGPAIHIARAGYSITQLQHTLQARELDAFHSIESKSGSDYFLKNARPYNEGDLFQQEDLANLLECIASEGVHSFYLGEIAQKIDEDMRDHSGFLRAEDLALIPWPVERKPLKRKYRNTRVFTCPPPTSGRTLLLVLLMLNNLPSKFLKQATPESFHFMAETFRKALINRKERPFDPNTYPQTLDEKKILSREYAKALSSSIRDQIDPTLPMVDPYPAESDTTHLSVMDKDGNAVGITQSIERVYGSRSAARGLGFLYNNYMSALETKDPSHPYYLRPNAIPWSSVSPVLVFHNNKPWLIAGSPGSERIFSTISQFLSHIIDADLPIDQAMLHPRLHCSIGGTLSLEADRFDPLVVSYLENVGYQIACKEPYSFYLGAIHAVLRCQTTGIFQGVAEKRRDGTAAGPQ